MKSKSMSTPEKAAASRAMEMLFPETERLYTDQYSKEFLTGSNRFFLNIMKHEGVRNWMMNLMEKAGPGIYGGIISRTKYMDDVLEAAIADKFDVVVNLGGGYDTKCLRFDFKGLEYYHVDQKPVMDNYKNVMSGLEGGIPAHVKFVPIDFNTQNLGDELVKAGYDKDKKTLFLWEGVTQYITLEAVSGTLEYIASCLKGSQVVFTYVPKSLFTSSESFPEYRKVIKLIKKGGEEWITGLEPEKMSAYLEQCGLTLVEDVGNTDYKKRYFEPIGREMDIMPIERIAYAEVKE